MYVHPYDLYEKPLRHATVEQMQTAKVLLEEVALENGFTWSGDIWHDQVQSNGGYSWQIFTEGELGDDLMLEFARSVLADNNIPINAKVHLTSRSTIAQAVNHVRNRLKWSADKIQK